MVYAILRRIGKETRAVCLKTFQPNRRMFFDVDLPGFEWKIVSPVAANHCQSEMYLCALKRTLGSAGYPLSNGCVFDYMALLHVRMRCVLCVIELSRSGTGSFPRL